MSLSRNATVLRKQVIKIIGKTIGAVAHLIYGYIENVARELFVSTCQTEEFLKIHAKENNVPRKAATFATGIVQFPGIEGAIILEDTTCIGDNGVQYRVISSVEVGVSLVANCTVVALESGVIGNLSSDSSISLSSEIPGITSTGTVHADGIAGGTDIESISAWKSRILRKKQRISLGGTKEDWEDWLKDCPQLTPSRVWVTPNVAGLNTVTCMFVFDDRENIIPTETDIVTMTTWIESQRPIRTTPVIVAVTLRHVGFVIRMNPHTQALTQSINNALREYFTSKAEAGGTLLLSDIRETVSYAAGSADNEVYAIIIDESPVTIGDITVGASELAIFDESQTTYELRI